MMKKRTVRKPVFLKKFDRMIGHEDEERRMMLFSGEHKGAFGN